FVFQLVSLLSAVCAANLGYLPRQTQPDTQMQLSRGQAYYYNAPSSNTMAALRRIVLGHLQRFQQADRERERTLMLSSRAEVQPPSYRQAAAAASQRSVEYAVPPNTPTPKNYAMNFLPEGRDVAPGTSYIPLRLLLIRR
ncbi:hypothetical protein KR222_011320, partial [Zaprionus bogoriensis]